MGWAPPTSLLILLPASAAHPPTSSSHGSPSPQDPLSLSVFPVKVPTRRTFMDPQSCGDPLQALHLFAKELDAKSVTVERSLGAGKLGTQKASSLGSITSALAPLLKSQHRPPALILGACLHPNALSELAYSDCHGGRSVPGLHGAVRGAFASLGTRHT